MRYLLFGFFLLFLSDLLAQVNNPSEMFLEYETKSFDTEYLASISRARTSGTIFMQIDRWSLELEKSNIIAEDYKSIDQDGHLTGSKSDLPIPMRGFTSDGGRVSLTIGENFVYGFIQEGNDLFYIEPARYYSNSRNLEEFIIYNTKNIRPQAPGTCGFEEVQSKMEDRIEQTSSRLAGECFEFDYVICNDYSIVSKYGGVNGANAHAVAVTNDVNENYSTSFNDEYRFIIAGNYNTTCSGCDPAMWTSTTNSSTFLSNFRTWGESFLQNNFTYDVSSLWTNRDFDGSTIGVAYLNAICGTARYNVLQDFSSNADQLRVLTAHELGHNCGSNHDGSGSSFIMAPSVPSGSQAALINSWSSQSISSINSHLESRNCLQACTPATPIVNWVNTSVTASEEGATGSGGICGQPFTTFDSNISINKVPQGNVTVSVIVSATSTSTASNDYEILNSSVVFSSNTATQLPISIRIYDDQIEESIETLVLNLVVSSGDANLGTESVQVISILSNDAFNPECCIPGDIVFYGQTGIYYNITGIFNGNATDGRSRILVPASSLNSLGITGGFIDMLSFYVFDKSSTGVFNDFRIGIREVSESNLNSSTWYETTQVMQRDISTTNNAWNNFEFDTPFEWNGSSNLYIEICFNNSTNIGLDRIAGFNTGSINADKHDFLDYSSGNGCSNSASGGSSYADSGSGQDLAPIVLFRQAEVVTVETSPSTSGSTSIQAGEEANLVSGSGRIIATVRNTGATDIGCVSGEIQTFGVGKSSLPFGLGDYSNKSIYIDAGSSGSYSLTIFYDNTELDTWGSSAMSLKILKSDEPIANSNSSNSIFNEPTNIQVNAGAPNSIAYSASFTGSGYFALTDGQGLPQVSANVTGTFENADVVIGELGKGLLLKNNLGQQYLLSVDPMGNPVLTEDNSSTGSSFLPTGDLCIISPGKSLMIKRNSNSFSKIFINDDGSIVNANTSTLPSQRLTLNSGHFGLIDVGSGVIFQNMENECYKLFVDENGLLKVGTVSCP